MQGSVRVRPRFYVFVIVVMILCFGVSFLVTQARVRASETRADALTEQRNALAKRESELREQLDYVKSDDYVIRVARDELCLVMPGEYRYVAN